MTSSVRVLWLIRKQDALATGGELGILEGRTSALIHPAIMLFLFGATAYTGWLGYNWRRARALIPEEIAALKARMPAPAGPDAPMQPEAVALQAQVEALGAERKQLLSEGVKDNHFSWGSLLLSLGVAAGVVGPLNTYIRTGKLFPGPHLYAGAGSAFRRAFPLASSRCDFLVQTVLTVRTSCGAVGGGGGAGAADAEEQRRGAQRAHRAQHGQPGPLCVADPHRPGNCGQSV